jgi:aspartokinase-like uncharacterized kinase
MWVVKLGGSLLGSPELPQWLDTLVKMSDGKVLIVPGGSVFADAVRLAQQRSSISDVTAHHLALLAMDQFGLLLAGMNPDLVTASSELEIAERGWQHRGIVWLPSDMVMADENIAKNWRVTSDSLSAWIAKKISAEHLLIVKSASLTSHSSTADLQALIDAQVLDQAFTEFFDDASFSCWVLHKTQYQLLAQGLDEKQLTANALKLLKHTE